MHSTVTVTHAFPAYFWPNDPSEVDRLDFQYEILKHLFEDRNYFSPLSNPTQILDIGTGTGQWCIEMGEEFPEAEVQGTDLSPIQPTTVPENVRFFVDDAADEDWVLPPEHFDFIHTRMLLGCFTDFRDIIQKAFHHLKPGGFMESQEIMPKPHCDDGTMPADWAFTEWVKYSDDAAMQADKPLRIGNKLKRWYEAYGFIDVQEKVLKLPMNPWPKDKNLKTLGAMSEENWVSGIQGFSMAPFSRILNWSKAEIEVCRFPSSKRLSLKFSNRYISLMSGRQSKIGMFTHTTKFMWSGVENRIPEKYFLRFPKTRRQKIDSTMMFRQKNIRSGKGVDLPLVSWRFEHINRRFFQACHGMFIRNE